MNAIFCLASIVCCGLLVDGYPDGAPSEACINLIPQHNVSGQTTPSPFELNIMELMDTEKNCYFYVSGREYNISLTVKMGFTDEFEGFLIQSRLMADGSLVGTFVPPSIGRFHSCMPRQAGITHNITGLADHEFTETTFQWTGPPAGTGPLQFHYTVVEGTRTFWVNIKSPVIEEGVCTSTSSTAQLSAYILLISILFVAALLNAV